MMVDSQEAMGVETQAPERNVVTVAGASIATIESLRARLLSERAASKEARQHAHDIALKVSELQSRLDAEIENRKKAEVEMKEVLEVLRAKGVAMEEIMTAVSFLSGSSESEEGAQLSSSKDGESEHSSSEEASQIHIGSQQGSVVEASHTEAVRSQLEAGGYTEESSSDKTQITLEDSLRRDGFEVEKVGVSQDEGSSSSDNSEAGRQELTENKEVNNDEHALLTDVSEEHSHTSGDQVGEESNISQSPEMLINSAKHLEGPVMASIECKADVGSVNGGSSKSSAKATASDHEGEPNAAATVSLLGGHQLSASLPNASSSSHADNVEKSKGVLLHENAPKQQSPSGLGDKGAQGDDRSHSADDKMGRKLMAPPFGESILAYGHNRMHPGFFPRVGYPYYEWPYINVDPLQHMHCMPSSEAPFSRGPTNTAYGTEYGRYPQVPKNDAILSLVDDKSGKLGSILTALNLAKQQINDEEYAAPYMEEVNEAASSSPFSGKPYLGVYDGIPHQPPYRPPRPEPQNQAPIIHLPMSPTSDYEASAFERHDRVRRSSTTSSYYMPGYDPYLPPKGEVHLGNGITLYTD